MIRYEIKNKDKSKKVAIIQHGAFSNGNTMRYVQEEFEKGGYVTILTDLTNHKEIDTEGITSIYDMAEIMREFIRKLKETKEIAEDAEITYIGWSMGGSIGLDIACKQEEKGEKLIDKLILVNSSFTWGDFPQMPSEGFKEIFKGIFRQSLSPRLTEEEKDAIMENFDDMLSPVETSMNDIIALRGFNVEDKLKDIKVPVLIFAGELDGVATVEWQKVMSEKISNSKLFLLADEGHGFPLDNAKFILEKTQELL